MSPTHNPDPMKVRIGLGIGAWPFGPVTPASVLEFIDTCEALDIDSLWLSDRIAGRDDLLEPVVFMAFMASRMRNMLFGTSVIVLPVRHPVVLAKELATLDLLSGGRLLPAVGIGPPYSEDFRATGIERNGRGRRTDEAIRLMKRLWTEDSVTFHGEFYSIDDISVTPKPAQAGGPPIWIGGRSQAAYKRAGTLGDGWLSSSITVEEAGDGVESIKRYAAEAGRHVPEDHFGIYLPFLFTDNRECDIDVARPYLNSRPEVPDSEISAVGNPEEVRARVQQYIDRGATKFVMRPACPGHMWHDQLETLAREVIKPIQTPFSMSEREKRAATAAG